MRKSIAVTMTMLLVMAVLTGCGGSKISEGSAFVGTWEVTKASFEDIEVAVDATIGEFVVEVDQAGTCRTTVRGTTEEGEWVEEKDGLTIQNKTGEFTLKSSGVELIHEEDDIIYTFEKQK